MRAARDERGFVVFAVLGVLLLALILSAAAVQHVMAGLQRSGDDQASKRAVAAAGGGLRMAVYRQNQLAVDVQVPLRGTPVTATQCVAGGPPDLPLGVVTISSGWCESVAGDLGTGAEFAYRVSPLVTIPGTLACAVTCDDREFRLRRSVVSVGRVDGQVRRMLAVIELRGELDVLVSIPGVTAPVVTDLEMDLYSVVPGSIRECRGGPPSRTAPLASLFPSPPDRDC